MNSLSQLNAFAATNINITDNRLAGVKFDRVTPLLPLDQSAQRSTLTVTVNPGINIVEIIKFATANVRLRVKTIKGDTDPIATSTVAWASLPSGVTLTTGTNVYTLSGINTVAAWEAVKSFSWTVSSDYTSKPLWFLNIAIVYYNESLGVDVDVDFNAYDPDNYYVAKMQSTATSTINGRKVRLLSANLSAQFKIIGGSDAQLTATTSMTASFDVTQRATLTSTATMNVTASRTRGLASSITSTASVSIDVIKLLSMRIYVDPAYLIWQVQTLISTEPYTVFWGDGTSTSYSSATTTPSHTYATAGYRTVLFSGNSYTTLRTGGSTFGTGVEKVYSWGESNFTNFSNGLQLETLLNQVPTYLPTSVTNMRYMFIGCGVFNDSRLTGWNVSNVEDFENTFANCSVFNQNIGAWNTGSATDMNGMFRGAIAFNQNISSWDTSNVTDMIEMFENATAFNQDLSSWDVHLIATKPTDFDNGATAWTGGAATRPIWGTTGS